MSYTDQKIIKNSIFLKVEQGTPHTIRLLDDSPTEQWQHKIANKLTPCGGDMCAYCDDGHSRNQRFVTNAYDHTDGKVVLWSYASTVAQALKSMALGLEKDGESILNHDLEISVQGEGMQKKTAVQLRFKSTEVPVGIKKHKIGTEKAEDQIPF
jgi:hypothetical protein